MQPKSRTLSSQIHNLCIPKYQNNNNIIIFIQDFKNLPSTRQILFHIFTMRMKICTLSYKINPLSLRKKEREDRAHRSSQLRAACKISNPYLCPFCENLAGGRCFSCSCCYRVIQSQCYQTSRTF